RSGTDPEMAYFEWSADPEADPYDPATWEFHPGLGVVPTEVGYAAGWWVALQRGVAAVMIIGVEEGGELCEALGFAGVGARVGPFLFQGAVEPLDLAVGLGPVGAGAFVRDLLAQGGGEGLGPVGGPVVGQHPFDDDPARGEVVIGTVPERG